MTPTNQCPRDYDGIQRQNADAAADTLNNWIERARKAEKALREMGNVHAMNTHSIIELTKDKDRLEARNKRLVEALGLVRNRLAVKPPILGPDEYALKVADQAIDENNDCDKPEA